LWENINKGADMELWDLLDRDRKPLNRTHVRGEKMEEGTYHLVVHVCLFNDKNQLLIQKRQAFKKGWSGMWDISVGGSAISGDTSRMAAEREAKEELGIDIDLSNEIPRFTINFDNGFDDYWMTEYKGSIEELTLQASEVEDAKWADIHEIKALVEKGDFVPYFFIDQIFDLYKRKGAIHDPID